MPLSIRFICCWASRDVANLGTGIFTIGLLAWSYHLEESSSLVSIILMALIFPPFILGPAAARLVYGDRAYPVGLAAQCVVLISLFPLIRVGTASDLPLVLAMSLAIGTSMAFIKASRRELSSALVEAKIATIDMKTDTTRLAILIVGPAAGTIVYNSRSYGSSGFSACVIGAIIALAISTGLLIFSRPAKPTPSSFETRSIAKLLADAQKGLIHICRQPMLRTVASIQLLTALLIGGLVVVQVTLMVWGAFTSADSLGIVLAAQGLGMAITTLGNRFLFGQLYAHSRIAIGLGLVAGGCFSFGITNSLTGSVISGLVTGSGLGISGLALISLLGKFTDAEIADPVRMGLDLVRSATVILSVTFLGRITDHVGPRYTIVLLAILLVVLALCAFGIAPAMDIREGEESTYPVSDLSNNIEYGMPTGMPLG